MSRIVNLRFSVRGLSFDAAIDCDWKLHCYSEFSQVSRKNIVPIELYCLDMPDWDIKMLFLKGDNDNVCQSSEPYLLLHTSCEFSEIMEGAKEWITEMTEKEIKEGEEDLFQ